MTNKWSCPARSLRRRADVRTLAPAIALCWLALGPVQALASDPPDWMRSLPGAPVPAHEDKDDAVILYSETVLTVEPSGKLKRIERTAYKILRPDGARLGVVSADFDEQRPVTDIHAWSIPPSGKYFEAKNRDAVEMSLSGVDGAELISDLHVKALRVPATPGSIVGFEVATNERPYLMNEEWILQERFAVADSRYTLELPAGWDFKATWINHPEVAPTVSGARRWTWTVGALPGIPVENAMPPWNGIAARMVLSFQRPGNESHGWLTWSDVGAWYTGLTRGRRDATPAIQQKVSELTAGLPSTLAKIRALARFVQTDIRYVAIELGIGGQQPHAASDVFTHHYGDCKDKVTLLATMLKSIGVDSAYVLINTVRGTIAADTQPNLGFDHVILAIQLPSEVKEPTLLATVVHPSLGRILYFDPTDPLTPLGGLPGPLQANYGLLVAPAGGELVELPQLPPETNSVTRTATFTLDEKGALRGTVSETWTGDRANAQRARLRSVTRDEDRIKPIESLMTHALSDFSIVKAAVRNLDEVEQPFEWHYSIEAGNYARATGDLLLVRPRVFGEKSSSLLETKDARHHPIEFDGPMRDSDVFEITLPQGFNVEELPPPAHADYDFGSYRSKTEVVGRSIRYTRSLELKQLSVPAANAEALKEFYRVIYADERRTAVLVKSGH